MKPESSSSACLQVLESRDFSRVEVSKEQKPDAELNAKYVALQEKYLKNTERFAEKIYQMANIISGFAELKSAKISNSAPERLSNVDDVFVG